MNLNKILKADIFKEPFIKYKLEPINNINLKLGDLKTKINPYYKKKTNIFFEKIVNVNRSDWNDDKDKILKPLYIKLKSIITSKYNGENVTVAWMKLYELLNQFNLVNNNDHIFFICESPGGFIFALNHFCKIHNLKYNWTAQSLNPNQKNFRELFVDEFGLMKNKSKNYDFGITNTGDVTSINNIKYYHNKYKNKFNFVISDCGLDCSKNFKLQEETLCKILWSQFILALGILKNKGNYIMKMFTFENYNTQNLLSLINYHFEETYITKPKTSKKFSNEIYIVAKNFKGISSEKLNFLIKYLTDFNSNKSLFQIPTKNLDDFKKISDIYSNRILNNIEYNDLITNSWDKINNDFINKLNNIYSKIDLEFLKEIKIKPINNKDHLIPK
tara:strand:+ start:8057 stop:9220 length:1164 start_codon:yes stop_codon:yes gene_type:complete